MSDAGDPIGATDTNVQVRVDQLTEVGGTVTSAAVQLQGVGIEAADRLRHRADDAAPGVLHLRFHGALTGFGNDHYLSYLAPYVSSEPVVAMEQTGDGGGYWMLATDGGLFAYGDAGFYGSPQALRLNGAMVGMAATADGGGYWMAGSDGGVFAYGDAGFHGSAGNLRLNAPIVGMAATPDGRGYWLVAADGGVFAYGDAGFHGSAGGIRLNRPIVGMAATPDGRGYWLVASDGGVFAYGDATFHGSAGGLVLRAPVVGMATSEQGDGYWLVAVGRRDLRLRRRGLRGECLGHGPRDHRRGGHLLGPRTHRLSGDGGGDLRHRIDAMATSSPDTVRASSFGSAADAYDTFRPGPPAELARSLGPVGGATAVDVAAGTGLVTRFLAGLGARVTAVEPDTRMGSVLRSRSTGVSVVAGSAEALPVTSSSVDLITVSSAWHWFDHERAAAEFARVLRPAGRLVVLWNSMDYGQVGWMRELRREVASGRAADPPAAWWTSPVTGSPTGHRGPPLDVGAHPGTDRGPARHLLGHDRLGPGHPGPRDLRRAVRRRGAGGGRRPPAADGLSDGGGPTDVIRAGRPGPPCSAGAARGCARGWRPWRARPGGGGGRGCTACPRADGGRCANSPWCGS